MHTKKMFLITLFFLLFLSIFTVAPAFAAGSFSQTFLRYDRMKIGTLSSMQLLIVPKSTGTEAEIKIVFGAGITVSATAVGSTTNLPTGSVGVPGTLTITGAGSSMVIAGVTDLTVGTTYVVNIGSGVSTPAAAGQTLDTVYTQTAAHAAIDNTTVASRFISDDQLVITGNVPPSFTFVLSGNTDAFTGDINSSSVVSTTGKTVTVTTNANKGWIGWVKSTNAGLLSVTTGESIGTSGVVDTSPTTCVAATDCYVLDADKTTTGTGGGSLTIAGEYNGTDTNSGGTLSTNLTPFVTRTGKTDGDVITLIARATMISTKAAADDYTDTLTIIGAGNF